MNKRALNNTDFIPRDFNPHQRLKYLDFLHNEDSEEDYVEAVRDLLFSLEGIDITDLDNDSSVLVRIIQHCLNASGKLFVQNQEADAFDLLESARNMISESRSKDPTLEKIKTVLYNNISSYCIGLGEDSMAVKFLQNCLRDDVGSNSSLTCIFYNNLSSIYLTHSNYERAFWYTKKSLSLLEDEIFAEMKDKSSKILKEDHAFLKKLTVLLIGYLNMGSTLEGYQSKTPDSDSRREMLEMNPRDFFKNAYRLAKQYLGPDNHLTERLEFCNTKSEVILFKETPSELSDVDMYSSPKQKLKNMLNSIDNEGNLSIKKPRFKMSTNFSTSISTRSLPKDFKIRKYSYQRPVRHRHHKIDSSATSYDSSVEGFEPNRIGSYYQREYSRHQFHPEESYSHTQYRRPRSGMSRNDTYQQNSFVSTPDQTQIVMQMQMMLQKQRDLEDKLYRTLEEIKSISKFNSFDNTELKTMDSKDKEDPKVLMLERELESLRNQLSQMNVEKEDHRNRKKELNTEASRKLSSESNISYQANGVSQNETTKKAAPPQVVPAVKVEQIPRQKQVEKIGQAQNLEIPEKPEKPTKPATMPSENPHRFVPTRPAVPKIEKEPVEQVKPPSVPAMNASSVTKEPNKKKNWIPGKVDGVSTEEDYRERGQEENFDPPGKQVIDGNTESKPMTRQTSNNSVTVAKPVGGLKREKVEKLLGAKPSGPGAAAEEEEQPKPSEIVNKPNVPPVQQSVQPVQQNVQPIQQNGTMNHMSNTEESKLGNMDEERPIKSDTSDRYRSFNIESMDSPKVGNRVATLKVPKYAVLKKKVFLEDDAPYTLICTARWTQAEKVFKLQLIQDEEKTGTESKDESKLELPYHDLCRILEHVEYKDVMPVTFHINQIKTFYTLMRHLLLPFTTVITTEEGKKEIAIYPKPPNLLTNSINDMPIIKFLGIQCVIIFTHVIRNTFRIILTDPESVDEAVRIDVDFDKTSFEKCFQRFNGSEAPLRSAETSLKIIQGFDDDADDDEVNEFKDIHKRMLDPTRCDEEELDSFKVINKDLVDDLGNILKEMDGYLTSIGISELSQLADERKIKYCKLKVTNKMKRSTLHFVLDKPEKQILEVKVKNFFETFSPEGKVKALGEYDYRYDSVWKHFGLTYTQLEVQDKIAICSLISDIYHLDIFEKEMDKGDFDRYEENAISFVSLEIGAFNRTFLGEKHKFPLTLSLVGIRGEPRGIRATIYNVDDAYEIGGFFHINPTMWAVAENADKKKKKAGRMATLTLIEHYYLDFILKKCGWEILKDWLLIERKPLRIDIKGIKVNKGCRHMEQLENILDSGAVLKYLMEKDNEAEQ